MRQSRGVSSYNEGIVKVKVGSSIVARKGRNAHVEFELVANSCQQLNAKQEVEVGDVREENLTRPPR